MSDSIFNTIVTGVSVFVLGQVTVKAFLEPYLSFKEQIGKVSALLLREQRKIMGINTSNNKELHSEIFELAAILVAKSNAFLGYRIFSFLLLLPPRRKVIEASKNLNLIASILEQHGNAGSKTAQTNDYNTVTTALNEVGYNLNAVVKYYKHE